MNLGYKGPRPRKNKKFELEESEPSDNEGSENSELKDMNRKIYNHYSKM
jgi:hypothetical protein